MTQGNIYMDFNATTPPDPGLREVLDQWLGQWGNPSSIHQHGRGPKKILRDSRRTLAEFLNCHPLELIFTSGGSESNNLAIKGSLAALKSIHPHKDKVIFGAIEHPSVMAQKEYLQKIGYEVVTIPVDRFGQYDLNFYKQIIDERVALVSVMLANNEVGVLAPIKEMVSIAHSVGAYFHSDCVQALGKINFRLKDLGVDLASFSGHKVYALKGCGLLFCNKGTPLEPQILGGAQERHRRAGTENVLAVASLAWSIAQLKTDQLYEQMKGLRDSLEAQLVEKIEGVEIFAQNQKRLPNTTSLCIAGVSGEAMMMNLDIRGFSVGTGAACSSGNPEPSPVLLAMGIPRAKAQSSLRITIGKMTTDQQINDFVRNLVEVVSHLRNLQPSGEVRRGI